MTDAPDLVGDWPRDGLERVERCPVCGERSRRLLYADLIDRSYQSAPGRWSLFRCARCGCAYLDPRPDERTAPIAYRTYYEGVAPLCGQASTRGIRRLRRRLRNGYLNSRYDYRLSPSLGLGRLVVPLLPRYREMADEHVRHLRLPHGSPRLLDVGCGEGAFLAEMKSLGWSIEGLDPSADAVAIARARGIPAVQGALAEGSLEPESFDAITFRLVLEHLRDPVTALAECRRALKRHGILWIATPNLDSDAHRRFGRDWIHLEPPRHAVLYTASALTRLLGDLGFDVIALRSLRQAGWSFRLSETLMRGLAPFDHAPPLSRSLALRAALADVKALRRPEAADVMVFIARAT